MFLTFTDFKLVSKHTNIYGYYVYMTTNTTKKADSFLKKFRSIMKVTLSPDAIDMIDMKS